MQKKSKPKESSGFHFLWGRPRELMGLIALVLLFTVLFFRPGHNGLEHKFYDVRLRLGAMNMIPSDDILVVAIDDESLTRMEPAVGRWPWPRAVYAGLLDYMSEAKTISMDVLFPEEDWQFSQSDDLFASEVSRLGNVILGAFLEGGVWSAIEEVDRELGQEDSFLLRRGVLHPYDRLYKAAAGIGHINIFPDPDGVVRQYPMIIQSEGLVFPSLGKMAVDLAGSDVKSYPRLSAEGFFHFQHYRSPPQVIPVVDILDSWNRESNKQPPVYDRSVFAGKHVFVGSLATGLHQDRRVTPWGVNIPGVLIAAAAVNNVLDGIQIRRAPGVVNFVVLLLMSVAWLFVPGLTPLGQLLRVILILIGFVVLNVFLFVGLHIWVDGVLPCMALVAFSGYNGTVRWYHEWTHRRHLEELEAAKQELTDMLVHDLKGRSSSILMAASMLKDGVESSDAEQMEVLFGSMLLSAQRLVSETSGLLDIRKMNEGRMQIRKENFSVKDLLDSLVIQNSGAAKISGLTLVSEVTEDVAATGDADLIGRVVSNLIWNAIQHGKRGSTVYLNASRSGEGVTVGVDNDGNVIESHRIKDLFVPFLSGETVHLHPDQRRSGLGLAFCKLAMEAHQGDIDVISPCPRFDGGACFQIFLPNE